jgi:imidazolonepropionase-like amidohydrolase
MKRAIQFTQAQVRRAVKAAESAGLSVRSVTVNPDGSITINSGDKAAKAMDTQEKELAASWDDFR